MKGTLLDFSTQTNNGAISADDGRRFTFTGAEWKAAGFPKVGQRVDFADAGNGTATGVYAELATASEGKSKIAAALLAFFLGTLGIHKFYLGYNKEGVIMLLCGTVGWLVILPGVVVAVVALIEFILYLVKSDAEFQATYVTGRKGWF
jgi:TM2 domain-containing membrane protein YozV